MDLTLILVGLGQTSLHQTFRPLYSGFKVKAEFYTAFALSSLRLPPYFFKKDMIMNLAPVIYCLASELDFRAAFRLDPVAALTQREFALEADMIQAILRVIQDPVRVDNLLTDVQSPPGEQDWA